MTENFEYTTDYPDYHPHITIAYLKPGCGKKYAEELKEEKIFEPTKYFYSFPDDRETEYFTK
jgi:2'-5' RNA ligase